MADDWPDRWKHVEKLLQRTGPFAEADFEPSGEVSDLDISSASYRDSSNTIQTECDTNGIHGPK